MKVWRCIICGYIYDESQGDVDHGIMPGTAWADVPEDFECPECGARKSEFDMVEL
jgi:rubredoxin